MQRTHIFMVHASFVFFKVIFILSFLFISGGPAFAQSPKPFLASDSFNEEFRGSQMMRVGFYNVENLFDYFNDSLTLDDEFLPNTGRYWTKAKYLNKVQKIAQTIVAIGGWEAPALMGLCEVESRYVLNSLVNFSLLKSAGYEFVHKDSPDTRGIDVALLYRPEKFELIDFDFIEVNFPFDPESTTRYILYAQGELPNKDKLHVFVNHWPSKFGGEFETAPKRVFVSKVLQTKVDSLLQKNVESNILIMGDLNDNPSSTSVMSLTQQRSMVNLMNDIEYKFGTHSFEGEWSVIDHLLVSKNMLTRNNGLKVKNNTAIIFDMDYLLVEGSNGNKRPFRTYQGPAYLGGFSDHLPIYLDLILK